MAPSRFHCRRERCSAAVSSSGDRAAAAEQVAGDALPNLGDHLVCQRHQVPLVDSDLGIR
jgi:hypothetical protein